MVNNKVPRTEISDFKRVWFDAVKALFFFILGLFVSVIFTSLGFFTPWLVGEPILRFLFFYLLILLSLAIFLFKKSRDSVVIIFEKISGQDVAKKIKKKANIYLISSIVVFLSLSNIGFTYLELEFSKQPMIFLWNEKDISVKNSSNFELNVSDIGCSSKKKYELFVEGDVIMCKITAKYGGASTWRISKIYSPNEELKINQIVDSTDSLQEFSFEFEISDSFSTTHKIELFLSNETYELNGYSSLIKIEDAKKLDEHVDWKQKKLTWFVGLLSFLFFSVFSGVRNIKELIEGN